MRLTHASERSVDNWLLTAHPRSNWPWGPDMQLSSWCSNWGREGEAIISEENKVCCYFPRSTVHCKPYKTADVPFYVLNIKARDHTCTLYGLSNYLLSIFHQVNLNGSWNTIAWLAVLVKIINFSYDLPFSLKDDKWGKMRISEMHILESMTSLWFFDFSCLSKISIVGLKSISATLDAARFQLGWEGSLCFCPSLEYIPSTWICADTSYYRKYASDSEIRTALSV